MRNGFLRVGVSASDRKGGQTRPGPVAWERERAGERTAWPPEPVGMDRARMKLDAAGVEFHIVRMGADCQHIDIHALGHRRKIAHSAVVENCNVRVSRWLPFRTEGETGLDIGTGNAYETVVEHANSTTARQRRA